jgi:hypothetical protein
LKLGKNIDARVSHKLSKPLFIYLCVAVALDGDAHKMLAEKPILKMDLWVIRFEVVSWMKLAQD